MNCDYGDGDSAEPTLLLGQTLCYRERGFVSLAGQAASPRPPQSIARVDGDTTRPMYPAIVFRSPKGWTGPKELDGHQIEGSWRSHQVPLKAVYEVTKKVWCGFIYHPMSIVYW